jgi:hypothetical protein
MEEVRSFSSNAQCLETHPPSQITSLAERSGMIGFTMFTRGRGHIHDSSIPITLESWGALGFFREVLKRDPADIAALFELWAVSRSQGKPRSILFSTPV